MHRIKLVFCACLMTITGAVSAQENSDFETWLTALKAEAIAKGFDPLIVEKALADVKAPAPKIIKRDKSQPEFKHTYARYLGQRLSPWRKEKGGKMLVENAALLDSVEDKYDVQKRFIASIWGIETNYGTVPLTLSVFESLSTLAYNPRRGPRFRREIFAAFEIIDKGYADLDSMKGSWAGAMGQPQFMPEAYLRYAQDFNGDGHKDIWTDRGDVFASIAHYLKQFGWRSDLTWGRVVKLPEGQEAELVGKQADGLTPAKQCKSFKSMGRWQRLSDWQALGIRKIDGSDLPSRDIPAALIIGDEGDGKGYLVYDNFCSIMRYNPSFKYALAVGMLSDTISYRAKAEHEQVVGVAAE